MILVSVCNGVFPTRLLGEYGLVLLIHGQNVPYGILDIGAAQSFPWPPSSGFVWRSIKSMFEGAQSAQHQLRSCEAENGHFDSNLEMSWEH